MNSGPKALLSAVLDLVYPRNCQFCRQPLTPTEPGVICAACLGGVDWIEQPYCDRCSLPFAGAVDGKFNCSYCADLDLHFRRAVAACRAKGIVRDAIHRFKYNRQMFFEPHLAAWLVRAGRERLDWNEVDVIVPVPLHPRKARERQFNQAEHLARAVHKAFGKPVIARGLKRVRDTKTQTLLDAAERRANLRRAFAPGRRAAELDGRRVVLVDDVFTTGATLDACARVLRQIGAADVVVLTVARGVF